MRTQYSYLSEPEKERIHRDSLRILAEIGVKFHSARARQILTRAGAKVDDTSRVARIPAELVEQAARAGKAIVLQKPLALTLVEADRIVDAV
ncbi:MAG: trimethylamine methyltransferase family protein, partial [Verrucomicrobia bacterium]|nr:trimethylamine methyltransferase family protein [Verrucomicrobiota bacterium]